MPVTIERLPAERATPASGAAAAGGCCSCCCCCLHSLGGLVLAATARARPIEPSDEPGTRTSVRREYWLSFLGVTVIALAVMAHEMRLEEALLFGAIFLPGAQLAASLLALIVSLASRTPGHRQRMKHLGWITLLGVIGGLVGAGVMFVLFNL